MSNYEHTLISIEGEKVLDSIDTLGGTQKYEKGISLIDILARRAWDRIASLPIDIQQYIAETYYNGNMPWYGDEVRI